MKGVILAAGMSRRLQSIFYDRPKTLVKIGDKSLLKREIETLQSYGINEVAIVVGFRYKQIMDIMGNSVRYIHNPWYASTNSMASLWFALPNLQGDNFIYLHSDILFDPRLLKQSIDADKGDIILVVDRDESPQPEDMKVITDNNRFIYASKDILPEDSMGIWTGIAKFTSKGAELMLAETTNLLYSQQFNVYIATALSNLSKDGTDIRVVESNNLPWIEIDYPEELELARNTILPRILGENI